MKLKYFLAFAGLFMSFILSGFQCSSTEITSAKLYIQQKNLDKAADVLLKEVEKNPKSDEGYYLLGYVYGEKDNMNEMVKAYNNSLALSDKFKKTILDSKKFFWAQYFNRGVKYFNDASKFEKTSDSAKIFFDKSVYSFKQAIIIESDSSDSYKNLAFVLMNQRKNDEALEPLQMLIKLQKSVDGYKYTGQIYFDKGDVLKSKYAETHAKSDSIEAQEFFIKAITVLEEGRKIHPNNSDILLHLSNAYIAANKVEIALDAFKSGVIQEPSNQYYRYNYGVLLLGKNDFANAAEQFKEAVKIDGDYLNAVYNLAVTYVKWGAKLSKETEGTGQENPKAKEKYKSALPYLESYIQKKPDDSVVWDLLGKVYSVLGQLNDAESAYKKADQYRNK